MEMAKAMATVSQFQIYAAAPQSASPHVGNLCCNALHALIGQHSLGYTMVREAVLNGSVAPEIFFVISVRYSVATRLGAKKGPSRCGRPKSREETPKEGYDGRAKLGGCRTAKYR
jgi:hypothetical protein